MLLPPNSLPILGSTKFFSVNKIICIGRNYSEHAREMGHDPEQEPPFFFFKPLSALLPPGDAFIYPWFSTEVHHEVELVIALRSGGRCLTLAQAEQAVGGFAIGLDMTCRDLQRQAKQHGRPWELAKGFDGSAPCSAIQLINYEELQELGELSLTRNGVPVQVGDWRTMVWSIPELLVEVSRYISLQTGDLIFTGTPAGVGPVVPGDRLVASLAGWAQTLVVDIVKSDLGSSHHW